MSRLFLFPLLLVFNFWNNEHLYTYASNIENLIKDKELEQSKETIRVLATKALNVVKTKDINKDFEVIFDEFLNLLNQYFAMNNIAILVLKKYWRQMKENDKKEFISNLSNMLSRTYSIQFANFKEAEFKVTGAKHKSKKQILVYSKASVPGKEPIQITWTIWNKTGKILDVNVGSVSIVFELSQGILAKVAESSLARFLKDFNETNERKNLLKHAS